MKKVQIIVLGIIINSIVYTNEYDDIHDTQNNANNNWQQSDLCIQTKNV